MVLGMRPLERLGRFAFQASVVGAFVFMVLPIALVLWLSFFSNEIRGTLPLAIPGVLAAAVLCFILTMNATERRCLSR